MRRRLGLSLIDVVFSASLLAVVFMILMNIFPTAMFSVRQSEHRLVAGGIAQSILEECQSGPFTHLVANQNVDLTTPGPLGDILRRSNHKGDDGMDYVPTLAVANSPTSAVPRSTLAQLRVEVSWFERGQVRKLERILQVASISR